MKEIEGCSTKISSDTAAAFCYALIDNLDDYEPQVRADAKQSLADIIITDIEVDCAMFHRLLVAAEGKKPPRRVFGVDRKVQKQFVGIFGFPFQTITVSFAEKSNQS